MHTTQQSSTQPRTGRLHGSGWAAVCILTCLTAACGGGGGDMVDLPAKAGAAAAAAAAAQRVQLAGCVVDQHYVPHEGVPVRVLAADGRLLGSARSGRAGDFKMQVPAGTLVALQVDADNGESITVQTQGQDHVVEVCLLARAS